MAYQDEYYYGQGRVYLAPYQSGATNWRWVGDVSSLKLNFEFEEKARKRSIGGKLVKDKRFITFTEGNVSMVWYERSLENLALVLRGKQINKRQSWEQEQFSNITTGVRVVLLHQNIRDVYIENLTENTDYLVDYQLGTVMFLITPSAQSLSIEYDYSSAKSVTIMHEDPIELMLRYEGINLAKNNETTLLELYRLSIDPVEAVNIIDDDSSFSHIETVLQMLPDLTKSPKSDFGLFGRISKANEFKTILYNDEINHDYTHDYAY